MSLSASLAAQGPRGAPGAQPKTPLLGWSSFWPRRSVRFPAIDSARQRIHTTSGRAALWAALQQMNLPQGSGVLAPTYHCPTMVAPIVLAGHRPVFYSIGEDGLPLLEAIPDPSTSSVRAMIVAHYFGMPASLREVRDWCQARNIFLVEDCAHSFFGMAGDRPVGQWGDYATASISKFFPVMEGGLLVSHRRPLRGLHLADPGLRYQIKSLVDPIELAARYGRLAGLQRLLALAQWIKQRGRSSAPADQPLGPPSSDPAPDMMKQSDMPRVSHAPAWASLAMYRMLPRARIVQRRRDHYRRLAAGLHALTGGRLLRPELPPGAVPYVCPLWVDGASRADAAYARMRDERLAVYRWDQLWPGVPQGAPDCGVRWSRELIQLICHQDLTADQIDHTVASVRRVLACI